MDYLDYYYGSSGSKKLGLNDLNGSRQLGGPEESYLYSSSSEMGPQSGANALGSAEMASEMGAGGSAGAAGAGMMAGGPAGAAIGVGSQFLMNYLNQRAADERQRKANAAKIEQDYAQNQNKAFDSMLSAYRGALR